MDCVFWQHPRDVCDSRTKHRWMGGVERSFGPWGRVVNDGADLDVSVVSFNGHTALRFTGIDPATGLPRPIVADSDVGPRNLLRNAAYTVATARPGETFHAVHQRLGPGSRSIGDLTVALLSYDLDTAGLLLEHIFTGLGGGATIADAVLPTGLDGATFMHFGDELELASSHGGHHVASATIDWYEIAFETVSSCPADFNADGFVDFFDYLEFVDAFERGC